MTDDDAGLPFLAAEWRRSAEAVAHALGFAPPAPASDTEWTTILHNVEVAARLRGVTEPPQGRQEALARIVGRRQGSGSP